MAGKEAALRPARQGRLSRWLFAALLVAAGYAVIQTLLPQTIGEQARRSLLRQLQEHYTGLSVTIGRGQFDPRFGFVFEDVRIADPQGAPSIFQSRQMVRIDRLVVITDLDAQKLLEQENPLQTQRIIIEGIHADTWFDADGSLSLGKLWPPPKFGPVCPRVEIRGARIRLADADGQNRPIGAELSEALILNQTSGQGELTQSISLRGSASFARSLQAQIRSADGDVTVRGGITRARINGDLLSRLPAQWRGRLDELQEIDGFCDVSGAVRKSADGGIDYEIQANVHQGRLVHPSLPMPMTDLQAKATLTPAGVSIQASQAMLGDALCRLSGKTSAYQWPCDATFHIEAVGLMLDNRLAASIPEPMRRKWDRLQPLGRIDLDASISHAQGQWETEAILDCKGVDVKYDKFPYPVQQLVGRVAIADDIATCESLHGRIGGRMLRCEFETPLREGITNEKMFFLEVDGAVPIDNAMLDALTPRAEPETKLESFIRSLQPRGSVELASAFLHADATGQRHRRFDLRIVNGNMRYEKFAYPLYNVNGQIRVEDDMVTLIGFKANNANAGIIRCDGTYLMPAKTKAQTDVATVEHHRSSGTSPTRMGRVSNSRYQPGDSVYRLADGRRAAQEVSHDGLAESASEDPDSSRLDLHFRAMNVPMDESLRSSLPASTQDIWDAISPSGVLDRLEVTMTKQGQSQPLGLHLAAQQHQTPRVTSRTLSLRPAAIPYRLDITGGTVTYDGSQVKISSLVGRHDASNLSADGRCVRDASERWLLELDIHSGSRLLLDTELIAALPGETKEAMRRLQLRGPVNVRGRTSVLLSNAAHPEPTVDWDLVVQLEGNRIGDVGPVHALRGELLIAGRRDDRQLLASGNVRIDSMHIDNLQITGIRGPFSIDNDRLRLGTASTSPHTRTANPISVADHTNSIRGRIFDGTIDLDGQVILSSGSFDVGLDIRQGRVPTLLADLGHANAGLTGTFDGQARLEGKLGTADLLKGSGAANVSGANVYQLPLLVQVLNLLRITPTEDVAFTNGDVEFALFGDQINFSQLRLWGDLVALDGGGSMNWRKELDLSFNTRVSPQNTFTKVIGPLRDTPYTLWTIDVRGPLQNPTIERHSLDGVSKTFGMLFPSIAPENESAPEKQEKATGIRNLFR